MLQALLPETNVYCLPEDLKVEMRKRLLQNLRGESVRASDFQNWVNDAKIPEDTKLGIENVATTTVQKLAEEFPEMDNDLRMAIEQSLQDASFDGSSSRADPASG